MAKKSSKNGNGYRISTPKPVTKKLNKQAAELIDEKTILFEVPFEPSTPGAGKYRIIVTNEMDAYDKPVPIANMVATSLDALEAVGGDNFSGTSRRAAKLSLADAQTEEFTDIQDLIATLPAKQTMVNHQPPITTAAISNRVAEEKRNVKLRVWLYAASLEKDNDFHLILGRAPGKTPKMYMTMELSGLPPSNSNSFTKLKAARDSFKNFFGNQLPGSSYHRYIPPIAVEIEGSLFFDINHATGTPPGPQVLRSDMPTIWEVHPISRIEFEPA